MKVSKQVMYLEPLGDRVLVRALKADELSAGGVVIAESSREQSQRAEVLSVGPGRYENGELVPVWIEPGDVLVHSKYGGTELPWGGGARVGGEDLLILRAGDVLAIERHRDETEDEARARLSYLQDPHLILAWRDDDERAELVREQLESRGMWDAEAGIPQQRPEAEVPSVPETSTWEGNTAPEPEA